MKDYVCVVSEAIDFLHNRFPDCEQWIVEAIVRASYATAGQIVTFLGDVCDPDKPNDDLPQRKEILNQHLVIWREGLSDASIVGTGSAEVQECFINLHSCDEFMSAQNEQCGSRDSESPVGDAQLVSDGTDNDIVHETSDGTELSPLGSLFNDGDNLIATDDQQLVELVHELISMRDDSDPGVTFADHPEGEDHPSSANDLLVSVGEEQILEALGRLDVDGATSALLDITESSETNRGDAI